MHRLADNGAGVAEREATAPLAGSHPRAQHPRGRAWRAVSLTGSLTGVGLIYVFLLGPIAIIVGTSFTAGELNTFPPEGVSLRWYRAFLESSDFTDAFRFSLLLAAAAAVGSTAIGFLAAYGITRQLGRQRELGQSLAFLPLIIPHLLIGISLLLALTVVPFSELATFVIGHVIICLPFTMAAILSSLAGVDADLERAAMTLGASRLTVLREIVLPLIAPGLLSALLFAFIVSFGDVYIALFLSLPGMTTLPIQIFTYMEWESTPIVAAITTIQVLLIVLLGLVVERLIGLRTILRV